MRMLIMVIAVVMAAGLVGVGCDRYEREALYNDPTLIGRAVGGEPYIWIGSPVPVWGDAGGKVTVYVGNYNRQLHADWKFQFCNAVDIAPDSRVMRLAWYPKWNMDVRLGHVIRADKTFDVYTNQG